MQHHLIKQLFYGLLYIALIQLKEGSRVLESGVGTGTCRLCHALSSLADPGITPKKKENGC